MGDLLADDAAAATSGTALAEDPVPPTAATTPSPEGAVSDAGAARGRRASSSSRSGRSRTAGHCVARHEGRVVFVRHALPGERVRARVTERRRRRPVLAGRRRRGARAPPRTGSSRPARGPAGRCGGCDWQHAAPAAQRELKAAVVAEQLRRLAGVEVDVEVEQVPVPGAASDGLGWRTRVQFAVDADGRAGLRGTARTTCARRPLPDRRRRRPGARRDRAALAGGRARRGGASGAGERAVVVVAARSARPAGQRPARRHRGRPRRAGGEEPAASAAALGARAGRPGRRRGAVPGQRGRVLAGAPRRGAASWTRCWTPPRRGRGSGRWTCTAGPACSPPALADGGRGGRVGGGGRGRRPRRRRRPPHLHDLPQVRIEHGRSSRCWTTCAARALGEHADVVVLDPPRAGAGRGSSTQVVGCARGRSPTSPATRPRWPGTSACAPGAATGSRLRAFDLFPMTHHVECVARLVPDPTAVPTAIAAARATLTGGTLQ